MTVYNQIHLLIQDGTVRMLISEGLMSPKILTYYQVYQKYSALLTAGYKPTEAKIKTSMHASVSERTVERAVKLMKRVEF
jgi:hypothetical protein